MKIRFGKIVAAALIAITFTAVAQAAPTKTEIQAAKTSLNAQLPEGKDFSTEPYAEVLAAAKKVISEDPEKAPAITALLFSKVTSDTDAKSFITWVATVPGVNFSEVVETAALANPARANAVVTAANAAKPGTDYASIVASVLARRSEAGSFRIPLFISSLAQNPANLTNNGSPTPTPNPVSPSSF